jgi:hypothetical protein
VLASIHDGKNLTEKDLHLRLTEQVTALADYDGQFVSSSSAQMPVPVVKQELPFVKQELPFVKQELPFVKQELPFVKQETTSSGGFSRMLGINDSSTTANNSSVTPRRWEQISVNDARITAAINNPVAAEDKHGRSVGGPWNHQGKETCGICEAPLVGRMSSGHDRVNICESCSDLKRFYISSCNDNLVMRYCRGCKKMEHVSQFATLTVKNCKARNLRGSKAKVEERAWERANPQHKHKLLAQLQKEVQVLGHDTTGLRKQQLRELLVQKRGCDAGANAANRATKRPRTGL